MGCKVPGLVGLSCGGLIGATAMGIGFAGARVGDETGKRGFVVGNRVSWFDAALLAGCLDGCSIGEAVGYCVDTGRFAAGIGSEVSRWPVSWLSDPSPSHIS